MSVSLEQDGLYILPHALDGTNYLIVKAEQTSGGWSLVENHETAFGSDEFKARSLFTPDQLIHYTVEPSGALTRQDADGTAQETRLSLANLSLIGYLRGGEFIPTEEGL